MESVKINKVDFDHLIKEVKILRQIERRELIDRLSLLMSAILEWQYIENSRYPILKNNIEEQRLRFNLYFLDSPSLEEELDKIMQDSYRIASFKIFRETGLNKKIFPLECPYTFEQLMDKGFYPGPEK